ncbi:V-type ATP synthase subunit D [Erysipelothrix inopinata]|uniref:V-type ATP synthase subunit D n=1 Tax=Erysipelothrix inopinata TaxID=225084 RepID=A0A7G9RXB0_9FIRM|nr:V-type ATP synthase subunit D [Erysipelothrix inopinata]QNN60235.1 V-type ATP synthase subunit D [Erysipelothrix inopinata]
MARLKVNPTRMELKNLENRLAIAQKGHKLLKEKQDSLIRNFMECYEDAMALRKQVDHEFELLNKDYNMASLELNNQVLNELLGDRKSNPHVDVHFESVMGIDIPVYEVKSSEKEASQASVLLTNGYLDRMHENSSESFARIVEMAALEKKCFMLSEEIKLTRRRVNALEYKTIPDIQETIRYIELRIDDQTRSQQARVMKVTHR